MNWYKTSQNESGYDNAGLSQVDKWDICDKIKTNPQEIGGPLFKQLRNSFSHIVELFDHYIKNNNAEAIAFLYKNISEDLQEVHRFVYILLTHNPKMFFELPKKSKIIKSIRH